MITRVLSHSVSYFQHIQSVRPPNGFYGQRLLRKVNIVTKESLNIPLSPLYCEIPPPDGNHHMMYI